MISLALCNLTHVIKHTEDKNKNIRFFTFYNYLLGCLEVKFSIYICRAEATASADEVPEVITSARHIYIFRMCTIELLNDMN